MSIKPKNLWIGLAIALIILGSSYAISYKMKQEIVICERSYNGDDYVVKVNHIDHNYIILYKKGLLRSEAIDVKALSHYQTQYSVDNDKNMVSIEITRELVLQKLIDSFFYDLKMLAQFAREQEAYNKKEIEFFTNFKCE